MNTPNTGSDDEPLVVSPKRAQRLLDVGTTRLYELIAAGELETYKEGTSRKITVRSIRERVQRKLAAPTTATPAT